MAISTWKPIKTIKLYTKIKSIAHVQNRTRELKFTNNTFPSLCLVNESCLEKINAEESCIKKLFFSVSLIGTTLS